MAGFIIVGDPSVNLSDVKTAAKNAESKFAMNKTRLTDYLSQVK